MQSARYLDVLTLPRVPATFGTALIGRSAYALVFLPLLYAVTDATGSVALAGLAVGLYGAGASFLAPVRAWFIDRFGARRALSVLVIVFGAVLTAIAVASLLRAEGTVLIVLAAVAGAFAPPLGPTMRVAWGKLAPTDELVRKSLSLDAVVEELLYLAGPAVAGIALAFIEPGAALLVPAGLVLVGGLLFVSTRAVGEMRPRHAAATDSARGRPLLLDPRFVSILLPTLVAGAISGSISISVPVVLGEHGGPATAGIALGLFAGGSALGGLLFGALRVPGSPLRQLVALAAALVVVSSLVAVVTGAVAVCIVLAAAGLFFSPVMIVAYLAAHHAGGEHRQNSATTWVNTSHNVGASAGSAVAGVLIQATSVPAASAWLAAVAVILLVASAVVGRRGRVRGMSASRPTVVFVCQKNGGKSQMAAALMRELAGGTVDVVSAGTKPGTSLNAQSVQSLDELGIDVGDEHPKALTADMVESADIVVVLGAEAQVDRIPGVRFETWITDEPSERGIEGMERMRLVRDDIRSRVVELRDRL